MKCSGGRGPASLAGLAAGDSFLASAFGASAFLGAGAAAAEASSPSASKVAMGELTFTPSLPSGTRILPMRPSSTASNSMVALSVSISARMSPDLTVSPSFTSQRASLPSSMVGDSAGIRMLVATGSILVANRFHRLDHILDGGKRQLLQIGGVRHGYVLAGNLGGRRVQIVERIQRHARADFRTDGADRPGLFHRNNAIGLLDRSDHGLNVERAKGAKIDDLGVDALRGQFLRRFLASSDRDRVRHQSHVFARARNARLADGQHVIVDLGYREGPAIEDFILQEDHRIGIADRRLE